MSFVTLLEGISPTFLGIIVGSLFTIIGVILTNASNTKRLRIQHEHERDLENKERDATLRRDTYLAAIEAISAGIVAVGRFSEINISQMELMQSYTDKSPAIAKVSIVGKEKTIEAVANFNSELTGTFLRLSSHRQKLDMSWQRNMAIEEKIEQATKEQERLESLIDEYSAEGYEDDVHLNLLRRKYELMTKKIEQLTTERDTLMGQLMPMQMALIQKSLNELANLDQLLTPVISLMRAELELPFDEAYYSQIIAEDHKKQAEYLEAFIREQAISMEGDQVSDG
jgi:hypothetical protein